MGEIKHYKFTTVVTIAVILLSVLPFHEKTPLDDVPFIDKWTHCVMYAGLSVAMWLDMKGYKRHLHPTTYILAWLLPSLLGGLLELVQKYLTTYRSGEWMDFVADALGAVIATVVCYIISHLCQKRTSARR